MKALKIFLYHLLVFVLGSIGLGVYFYFKMAKLAGTIGLGAIIIAPAVFLIYVYVFGIICLVSLIIWLVVSCFRSRLHNIVK